jgi:hypothetical protein
MQRAPRGCARGRPRSTPRSQRTRRRPFRRRATLRRASRPLRPSAHSRCARRTPGRARARARRCAAAPSAATTAPRAPVLGLLPRRFAVSLAASADGGEGVLRSQVVRTETAFSSALVVFDASGVPSRLRPLLPLLQQLLMASHVREPGGARTDYTDAARARQAETASLGVALGLAGSLFQPTAAPDAFCLFGAFSLPPCSLSKIAALHGIPSKKPKRSPMCRLPEIAVPPPALSRSPALACSPAPSRAGGAGIALPEEGGFARLCAWLRRTLFSAEFDAPRVETTLRNLAKAPPRAPRPATRGAGRARATRLTATPAPRA